MKRIRLAAPAPLLVFWILLLWTPIATAGPADTRQAWGAIVEFRRHVLGMSSGSMSSIEERIKKHLPKASRKAQIRIVFELDRAYSKKYDLDTAFLNATARMLAAGGKTGRTKLMTRFKAKRPAAQKVGIIDALAKCGSNHAAPVLLKMTGISKDPDVAAAAIRACGQFPTLSLKWRKIIAKGLAKQFKRVELAAGGKAADSAQMKRYKICKPAFGETLTALTGEKLNSSAAWEAWLKDNGTKDWDKKGKG